MVKRVGMGQKATQHGDAWEDYLEDGEQLLWEGAPATGLRLTGAGLILSLFGVVFLGFSLFWVIMAASMTSSTGVGPIALFPLFGIPFVLVGLWLVGGHWVFDAYKRRKSRYALTTRRALIARQVFGRKMETYPINKFSQINLIEGRKDTVNFAEYARHGQNGTTIVPIGFRFIEDGQKVYGLLSDIRRGKYEH